MVTHEHFKEISMYSNIKQEVTTLFREHDKSIKLKDLGNLSVIIRLKDYKYIVSSSNLCGKDVQTLEDWSRNHRGNRLINDLYEITLKDAMLFFKKFHSVTRSSIILAGFLTEINDKSRFIKMLLQSQELLNFNIHKKVVSI